MPESTQLEKIYFQNFAIPVLNNDNQWCEK